MKKSRISIAMALAFGLMAGTALAQNVSDKEVKDTAGAKAQQVPQGNVNPRSDPATMREDAPDQARAQKDQDANAQNENAPTGKPTGQKAGKTQEGGKTHAKKGTQGGPAPAEAQDTQQSSGAAQSSAETTGQGQGMKENGGAAGTKTPKKSGEPASSQHSTESPK